MVRDCDDRKPVKACILIAWCFVSALGTTADPVWSLGVAFSVVSPTPFAASLRLLLFLCAEPTSGLDSASSKEVLGALQKIARLGAKHA